MGNNRPVALKSERFYTAHEVAELLQLKWQTILRLLHSGELRGAQIGRRWRIAESDVEDFIARHTRTPKREQKDAAVAAGMQ